MKTLEVESWEALKGKYVRVEIEGCCGKILRIGHLMKDKWFSFKDYFGQVKKINEVKGTKYSIVTLFTTTGTVRLAR